MLTNLISNTKYEIILSLATQTTQILEPITNYADHTDIQDYMKNKFLTDYANYADFEYQIYFYHRLR